MWVVDNFGIQLLEIFLFQVDVIAFLFLIDCDILLASIRFFLFPIHPLWSDHA